MQAPLSASQASVVKQFDLQDSIAKDVGNESSIKLELNARSFTKYPSAAPVVGGCGAGCAGAVVAGQPTIFTAERLLARELRAVT